MTIIDWIKANAKEGANIAEAEGLVKDLDPLKNITEPAQALDFINRNSVFKSALDSETSLRIENHDKKFTESKLPGLLKIEADKIRAEINPKETPEQKDNRELRERLDAMEKNEANGKRKIELRTIAAEYSKEKGVSYDPLRAEKFVSFGDDAETILKDTIDYTKSYSDKLLEEKMKDYFKGSPPPGKPTGDPDKTILNADFQAKSPEDQMSFIKSGGIVTD